MHLIISSRRGHFNWCDPKDESISTWICVAGVEGRRYSITTDYEHNNVDPCEAVDLAADLLELDQHRYWIDTGKEAKAALRQFILDNREEITRGTIAKRLETLRRERDDLNETIAGLEAALGVEAAPC